MTTTTSIDLESHWAPSGPQVFWYQALSLGLLAGLAWVTELTNLSTHLFGTAAKWVEGILETSFVVAVGGPILVSTRRLASRLRHLEEISPAAPSPRLRRLEGGRPVTFTGGGPQETLIAQAGDGNLAIMWAHAVGSWVQSTLQPDRVGRVITSSLYETATGARREAYVVAFPRIGPRLQDRRDLRAVPMCCGERPMTFLEATRNATDQLVLRYNCRRCRGSSELVL